MFKTRIWITFPLLGILACLPPKVNTPNAMPGMKNVRMQTLMAKRISLNAGPVDVTNTFNLRDDIYFYSSFWWSRSSEPTVQHLEARWYNHGALILTDPFTAEFPRSPWNVWNHIPAKFLGAGKCRVDICSQGTVLDSHAFEITAP